MIEQLELPGIKRSFKIRKNLIIKTRRAHVSSCSYDYGVSEFVENPVKVEFFQRNHFTILKNSNLADTINTLFMCCLIKNFILPLLL